MMRRLILSAIVMALLLSAAAAFGLRWARTRLDTPFKGYKGSEVVFVVEQGRTGAQIIDALHARGVLESPLLCRLYLRLALDGKPLKAGEYRFRGPMTAVEVMEMLIESRVVTHLVTIREGLDLEETARALSEAGFGSLADFLEPMRSPALIADLDPEAEDLEGYLFPDTYAFASGTEEREIVSVVVAHARRLLEERIMPLTGPSGRSIREIVTLASIVEKESGTDAERPIIAGVYANRLARDIGLYADPTVIFALKRAGRWDGNIRRSDLQIDSPYNTYRYRGLPPGPIASPGLASLLAAAQPADVPYLYFVSRNDGTHVFSETLSEHNRNVEKWQKQYWRERWAAERRVTDSTDR